jgi:hypothetical protein
MKAQVYHPMLTDSAKWNIKFSSLISFTPIPKWGDETYSILLNQKDSTYNSKKYRIVDEVLMREDTANRKIYLLKDTIETLLYDFNLIKGDSFYFDAEYIPNTYPLKGWKKIDTTYFLSTLSGNRKIISVSGLGEWIEGVGSIYKPNYPKAIWIDHGPNTFTGGNLLCFWQNGNQVFRNMDYSSCYISTGFDDKIRQFNISIFPNPTASTFTISKNTNENMQFHLYNLIGQQVLNTTLRETETKIERNNLAAGTYLFSIVNASGKIIENGKLIFE